MEKRSSGSRFRLAILASISYCTIYGFSFMFSRIALMNTSADMLLAIRFTAAMLAMLLLMLTGRFTIDLRGKPVGRFLLLGLCQPVVYFIVSVAAGVLFLGEPFSPLQAAGIALILLGVWKVSTSQS